MEVTFDARGIPTVRAQLAGRRAAGGGVSPGPRASLPDGARPSRRGRRGLGAGGRGRAPARPAPAGLRVRHGGRGGGPAPSARGARRRAGARRRHQRLHRLASRALGARVPAPRARAPALDARRLHPRPAPHAPAALGELGARADRRGPRRAPRGAAELPPPGGEHRRRPGHSGRRATAGAEHRGPAHPRRTARDRRSRCPPRPATLEVLGVPLEPSGWAAPPEVGSNGWVLAGAHTARGKPILANDPHLGFAAPGTWYPMRIELLAGGRHGAAVDPGREPPRPPRPGHLPERPAGHRLHQHRHRRAGPLPRAGVGPARGEHPGEGRIRPRRSPSRSAATGRWCVQGSRCTGRRWTRPRCACPSRR